MKKTLLILFIFCAHIAMAQQFKFRNFSVAEGLAQSQVYAVTEDANGYMWFGTRGGGLSQFDGKNFRNFSTRDSLANNHINVLYTAHNGDLLIGTSKGLSIFNGLRFTNLELIKGKSITVAAIHQEENGRIWLGTGEGIFHYENGIFSHFSKRKSLPEEITVCFFKDSRNALWAGGDFGVLHIQSDDDIKHFSHRRNELNSKQVQSINEDKSGRIWVGTYGGGLNIYSDRKWSRLTRRDGLSSNRVLCLYRDKKDEMWIGTQDAAISIYSPQDSTFSYLTEADGLANSHIRTITHDSWGNIWIGTSGGGVSRYFGQQFTHYDESNGLAGKYVYALAQDTAKQIWLSASRRGVTRFDSEFFHHYGRDNGFTEMKAKALLCDTRGRVWIGTEGRGVAVYDSTGFHFYEGSDGLGGSWIRSLKEDKQGNIWIGTAGGGITKASQTLDDTTGLKFDFYTFRERDGLAEKRINDLHIDTLGRVWYATRSRGIGYISPDSTIVNFGREAGLPYLNVRTIEEDSSGVLWIGTAGNGVLKLPIYADTFAFKKLLVQPNLTSDNIYFLGFDKGENLYIGSEIGVDKIELDAERNFKTIKHFGKSEGFVGIETCQNAVLCDEEGNMWFGTINGLTKYNPKQERSNPIPPKILLTETRLFYEPLSQTKYKDSLSKKGTFKAGFALPFRENNLGFEFVGINQSNPEKVRYQWQLKGFENERSPFSTNTNATYANLPAGDYTFQVWAENEDGVISDVPAETSFTILKPFWQEWWFIASIIGGILAIIALVFRVRVNQIRARARDERARLEMENNLLQLEQKALQLQMNPHFIFNALASIQSLISKQDHKTARYYLAKFGKLMRAILENSRTENISLTEETELLDNYLALERFSRGNSFDYEINIADNCEPDEMEIPPMLLQPFVENAIIHGVTNSDKRCMIKLQFLQSNGKLRCEIEDNGIGRERAAQIKNSFNKTHKSLALEVTRERLEMLHPGKRSFWVEDLEQGTRVVLVI